jgi:superfamily II DNA helicase RecQ
MPRSKKSYRQRRGDLRYKPVIRPDDTSTTNVNFHERIEQVDNLTIPQLRALIRCCEQSVEDQHHLLSRAMCRLLNGKEPHRQQVRALRRLVYGMGDTILVAKTGFGKSIVFHAYSVLTGRITIQLIPLSKLGEEQLESIRRYPETKPCLVTANTKFQDPQLLGDIQAGIYTHILLGPEQATAPEFRTILQDPNFQSKVGLVAIDECHVLSQWKEFRSEYVMIHELRRSLLSETVFFGCSATLDLETENAVKSFGGFREEGSNAGQLEIIRTSVDRPDISICVLPILKGKMNSYEQLHFLLNQANSLSSATNPPQIPNDPREGEEPGTSSVHKSTNSQDKPTPQHIPKTIVFVDSKKKVISVASYLKSVLVKKGYRIQLTHQTIGIYTSNVPKYDQDKLYDIFREEDSSIRIVVATTALGMGMNILDIPIVVQWDIPVTDDLGDLWQRFGRAARGPGQKGTAILFAPYWAFDSLGYSEEKQTDAVDAQPVNKNSQTRQGARSRIRNMLSHDRQASRLRELVSAEDSDRSDSSAGTCSNQAVELESIEPLGNKRKGKSKSTLHRWTKREISNRESLNIGWKNAINNDCHREYLLKFLQEEKCDLEMPKAAPKDCCNGTRCNPLLLKDEVATAVSTAPDIVRKPTAGSRGGIAQRRLIGWCWDRAAELMGSDELLTQMPSAYFLPGRFQWAIAQVFNDRRWKTAADFPIQTLEDLGKLVSFEEWKFAAEWKEKLLEFLRLNADSIVAEWNNRATKKKANTNQVQLASAVNQTTESSDEDSTPERRRTRIIQKQTKRDNATALLASMHRKKLQERCNSSAITPSAPATKRPLTSVETDDAIQIPEHNLGKRRMQQLQATPTGATEEQDHSPLTKRSRIEDRSPRGRETGSKSILLKDHNKPPRKDGRPERKRSLTPQARESGLWET